jgi:hypothetical protein
MFNGIQYIYLRRAEEENNDLIKITKFKGKKELFIVSSMYISHPNIIQSQILDAQSS